MVFKNVPAGARDCLQGVNQPLSQLVFLSGEPVQVPDVLLLSKLPAEVLGEAEDDG